MEQPLVVAGLIIGLMVLLASGLPIAFALGLTGAVLLFLVEGWGGLPALGIVAFQSTSGFVLVAVPLFILMGNLIYHSGIGGEVYDLASKWLGWLPGGLATATVGACGVFGAMSGSSMAGTLTIGVSSIPEMRRKGYRSDLTYGAVAAAGGLAALIPPSLAMIVYGDITDNSIGQLFIAGILPGILVIIVFSLYHLWVGLRHPEVAPREPGVPWGEKLRALGRLWAPVLLIIAVLGSIYLGLATPTESAAIGALGAFIIMTIKLKGFAHRPALTALRDATLTTGMVIILVVGAMTFAYVATLAYIPQSITAWIVSLELTRWLIMAVIWVFLLILGMFFDGLALTLLSTPLVYPVILSLGFDPIWYGVMLVLNVEIGAITPPVGVHFYVVKGLYPDTPISTVIRGCFPYIWLFHVVVVIVAAMPWLATWLPSTMMKAGP